ncbi:MAG: NADP-dependent isocitrate dehydrogenase [Bdellovibrionaceae bacterium]|nr:NADP-dependent isocitrate dehydrogenase [Pseudobdellovibrionaceae bacterium]MDW8190366.1 NADP-dependent isocitrate dehydrogenase [Pseudobdellovibrionaceae bacterium]
MELPKRFTLCFGDGIGPEITQSVLKILEASGVPLSYDIIEVGEKLYRRGITSGIDDSSWEVLLKNRFFLKAPITTPQGGGYKSLNVTIRKTLGLFANIRPCQAYAPFVKTRHPQMDLIIIRENEEDLYAGIEYRQTPDVYQCLKLITRSGSEKIIRFAYEFARQRGRKRISCFTKDNIMKLTDGLFHQLFDSIGQEYPELQKDHYIIDIGAARLADSPERFDVIVTLNLYGDIISDIAAQIAGSVGLAGSANVGSHGSMYEAVHGSAPDIAGQNRANPSGLLMAAVFMLNDMGWSQYATLIENAWKKTIEDGIHTPDIKGEMTRKMVSTTEMTQAIIDRLGEEPQQLPTSRPSTHSQSLRDFSNLVQSSCSENRPCEINDGPIRECVGVDVFIYEPTSQAHQIAARMLPILNDLGYELVMISNRGVKVWPHGRLETHCVDHWRCRLMKKNKQNAIRLGQLLESLENHGWDIIKTENLYHYDGKPGYSLGQGQ